MNKNKIIYFLFLALMLSVTNIFSQSIVISEINYNSPTGNTSGDWVELYNKSSSSISLNGWVLKDANDLNTYTLPNTTLTAGGRIVLVNDVAKFTAIYPAVTNYAGPFVFSLSNTSDQVRLFNATNTLVTSVSYIDSLPWPRGADGYGRTLELLNANNPNGDASNWFDGCMGGSPGAAYTPCKDPIVFAEINYNSDSLFDTDDWVELKNTTNAAINIGGYTFSDGSDSNKYVIPAGTTLPAQGRLVLVQTTDKFRCNHRNVTNYISPFVFNLSGNGEPLRLFDASNKLVFSMIYDDNPLYNWPTPPDGGGNTLELLSATGKMNDGANWFSGCVGGSPGVAYNANCTPISPISPVITASAPACTGKTTSYSIPAVTGATYAWIIVGGTIVSGQGTTTVQVMWNNAATGTVTATVTIP